MKYGERTVWIPVMLVMLLIFIHSSFPADLSSTESGWFVGRIMRLLPSADPEVITFFARKAAHILEYLFLGVTLQRAAGKAAVAWLTGTGYAVSDELHQYFVPGRSCEIRDICIDAAGVLAGVLLILAVRNKKECTGH